MLPTWAISSSLVAHSFRTQGSKETLQGYRCCAPPISIRKPQIGPCSRNALVLKNMWQPLNASHQPPTPLLSAFWRWLVSISSGSRQCANDHVRRHNILHLHKTLLGSFCDRLTLLTLLGTPAGRVFSTLGRETRPTCLGPIMSNLHPQCVSGVSDRGIINSGPPDYYVESSNRPILTECSFLLL